MSVRAGAGAVGVRVGSSVPGLVIVLPLMMVISVSAAVVPMWRLACLRGRGMGAGGTVMSRSAGQHGGRGRALHGQGDSQQPDERGANQDPHGGSLGDRLVHVE